MKTYGLPKTNSKKLSTLYHKKIARMNAKQQIIKELNSISTDDHANEVLRTNFTSDLECNFHTFCDNCNRLKLNTCAGGCIKAITDVEIEEECLSDSINNNLWYEYVIN